MSRGARVRGRNGLGRTHERLLSIADTVIEAATAYESIAAHRLTAGAKTQRPRRPGPSVRRPTKWTERRERPRDGWIELPRIQLDLRGPAANPWGRFTTRTVRSADRGALAPGLVS